MEIGVRCTLNGEIHQFSVDVGETVFDLKRKVARRLRPHASVATLRLSSGDGVLSVDEMLLADSGVCAGDILKAAFCLAAADAEWVSPARYTPPEGSHACDLISVSPCGRWVAVRFYDSWKIHLYDVVSQHATKLCTCPAIRCLLLTAQHIVYAAHNASSTVTLTCRATLVSHAVSCASEVSHLARTPSETHVVAGLAYEVVVISIQTGAVTLSVSNVGGIAEVSPDARWLLCCTVEGCKLVTFRNGEVVAEGFERAGGGSAGLQVALAWSPCCSMFATAAPDASRVTVWSVTGVMLHRPKCVRGVRARRVCFATERHLLISDLDRVLQIDLTSSTAVCVHVFSGMGWVGSLAASPSGRNVLIGTQTGVLVKPVESVGAMEIEWAVKEEEKESQISAATGTRCCVVM